MAYASVVAASAAPAFFQYELISLTTTAQCTVSVLMNLRHRRAQTCFIAGFLVKFNV